MPRIRLLPILLAALPALAAPASAERREVWPVGDLDDGQLVDGTTWDSKLSAATVDDLLLYVGREDGREYACAIPFRMPDLEEGRTVADVRLRVNEQGGAGTGDLSVTISAALSLDPLATPVGPDRFALPRTTNAALWHPGADWDSSGQRVAKWEESPDLSRLVNEIAAQSGWNASDRTVLLFLEPVSPGEGAIVRFDETHPRYAAGGNAGIRPARLVVSDRIVDSFPGRPLLCRPRPDRVELNVIPRELTDLVVRWGTSPDALPRERALDGAAGGEAHHLVLDQLEPDTRYWYRLWVRRPPQESWEAGDLASFRTLPASRQELRFAITSDLHVTNTSFQGYWGDLDLLETSLDHLLGRFGEDGPPHLWLDLGDLVVIRATRPVLDEEETEQRYREAREYVDRIAHSVPFVLVRGNHEEISGWGDDGSGENDALWSGRMLLKYFPPPLPDDFYSGNDTPHPGLGRPGNWFAFTAGNLRIRCADPFLATLVRPHNGHGEVNGSLDAWDWTLGQAQYDWLVDDLARHEAPFDLFAIHHLTSSYEGPEVGRYYGRGGAEVAKYRVSGRPSFEWGGEDESGAYVLDRKRSFSAGSVHDVLVNGGNQVIVKGHDHLSVRQVLDDMIYLTVPKPDDSGLRTGDLWGWRDATFYDEAESIFRENSGFLAVTVDDEAALCEYVRTWPPEVFGQIADSFTVLPDSDEFPPPDVPFAMIRRVMPNPFRHLAHIEFDVPRAGPTTLAIHDIGGRRVRTILSRDLVPGRYEEAWRGDDDRGRAVAPGVYFARLAAGGRTHAQRMIVLR